MAIQSFRSLRAARVCSGPSLQDVQSRLASALGGHLHGDPDRWYERDFVSADPDVGDIRTFAFPYLFRELFSKLEGEEEPEAMSRTWEGFWNAENQCKETNLRLNRWALGPFSDEIVRMRSWIARILGPFSWDEALVRMAFGPGATTRLPRRRSEGAYKYSGIPHATNDCATLGELVLLSTPPWLNATGSREPKVELTIGNRVTSVPKNRRKRRMIAIEPDVNMYVQKGIGSIIRRRLQRVGIDLNDQVHNQELARTGSVTGRLATLDLSMASDTVAKNLVEVLLPDDWLAALGMCRSQFGVLPPEQGGKTHLYRKFSSMGNGYTFELESLIFASMLWAVDPMSLKAREASVYGDDLVIPGDNADRLVDLLTYCGFTLNATKSFTSGPFRESCGKHFFRGFDVTPFYVKSYDRRDVLSLMKLHNQIWRLQDRWDWLHLDERESLLGLCAWLRSCASSRARSLRIFDGFGDGAFVGYFDEILPTLSRQPRDHYGWDVGYYCNSFVRTQKVVRDELPDGALPSALSRLEGGSPSFPVYFGASGKVDHHDVLITNEGLNGGERLQIKTLRIRALDLHRQRAARS